MLKIKDNVDLKELEKFGFDLKQTKDKYDLIQGFDMVIKCQKGRKENDMVYMWNVYWILYGNINSYFRK